VSARDEKKSEHYLQRRHPPSRSRLQTTVSKKDNGAKEVYQLANSWGDLLFFASAIFREGEKWSGGGVKEKDEVC
jgi:hypothetical protein